MQKMYTVPPARAWWQSGILGGVALAAAVEQIDRPGHQLLFPMHDLARVNLKVPGQFVERALPFHGLQCHFRFERSAVLFTARFIFFLGMVLWFLLTHHLNHLSSFWGAP